MNDEEYRARILAIDQAYNEEIRRLLCRKQAGNATFVRIPELVFHLPEARAAAQRARDTSEAIEAQFYAELGDA